MRRLTCVLVFVVAASFLSSSGQTADAGRTLYLSPTGTDAGSCTQSRPCKSFGYAYERARPADVVEVRGGTYPHQRLSHDSSKTSSSDVIFRPAAGARVVTGDLEFGGRPSPNAASHVTVDGQGRWTSGEINFFLRDASVPASDVTIANMKLRRDAGVFIRGGDRITLRNVEIGPTCCTTDGMNLSPGDDGGALRNITNLVLDGVTIHDIVRYCAHDPSRVAGCTDNPDAHTDCIQAWTGINVVIRNSRFLNCSTASLIVLGGFGGRVQDWTIENNVFGSSLEDSFNFIWFSDNEPNLVNGSIRILYNSVAGSIKIAEAARAGGSTVDVVGNIAMVGGGCSAQVRYAYNLFTDGKRCGPTDRMGKPQFVTDKPVGTDLHIQRDSAAIAAGDPESHPARDIDGDPRPLRGAPDAGADQRERAVIVPGSAIGSIAIGKSQTAVEAAYGVVRLRKSPATNLLVGVYRARGAGALSVYYKNGRVVAVTSRSRFYSTERGGGAGGRLPAGVGIWDACRGGYRVGGKGRLTLFATAGGRRTGVVNEVTIATTPLRRSGWPLVCD